MNEERKDLDDAIVKEFEVFCGRNYNKANQACLDYYINYLEDISELPAEVITGHEESIRKVLRS